MGAGSARTSAVCLAWKTLVAGLAPGGLGAGEAPIPTFPSGGRGDADAGKAFIRQAGYLRRLIQNLGCSPRITCAFSYLFNSSQLHAVEPPRIQVPITPPSFLRTTTVAERGRPLAF